MAIISRSGARCLFKNQYSTIHIVYVRFSNFEWLTVVIFERNLFKIPSMESFHFYNLKVVGNEN